MGQSSETKKLLGDQILNFGPDFLENGEMPFLAISPWNLALMSCTCFLFEVGVTPRSTPNTLSV